MGLICFKGFVNRSITIRQLRSQQRFLRTHAFFGDSGKTNANKESSVEILLILRDDRIANASDDKTTFVED